MASKLTGDDETKADLLNSFFVSVFTHENTDIPVLEDKHQIKDSINISFTTDSIEKKLKKLKITKSAGPDGFHPRALSEISPSIKLPLSIICTKSYNEGRLPTDWEKCPHHTNTQEGVKSHSWKLSSGQSHISDRKNDEVHN